jgi:hypothetical protein
LEVEEKHSLEVEKGSRGCSLGLPYPLGERGGTLIAFLKRMKSDRISPKPKNNNITVQ